MRFLSVLFALTCYSMSAAQPLEAEIKSKSMVNSQSYALYYHAGDGQVGVINKPSPSPLQVKIVDLGGQPVADYPVIFTVITGGGHFDGDLDITSMTNTIGIAAATPTLGKAVGNNNNIFRAQAFNQTGGHLTGSPAEFRLSARKSKAKKITAVSGNYQSAQAGQFVLQPLVVRVVDADNQAVAGHDVLFQVVQGSGILGNEASAGVTRFSNGNGIVEADFKLGTELGNNNHVVRISADDGIFPLEQSPLYFYASAPYGIPDARTSKIFVPDTMTADGLDEALITIELRDHANNPVPGERVTLTVSGTKNGLIQPDKQTNSNGQTIARLRSTKAEHKKINVRVSKHDIRLEQTAHIQFIPGPADHLTKLSGDEQTGTVNQRLADSLVISLVDFFDNAVGNAEIYFITDPGCGEILQNQPIVTDHQGVARAVWVLGNIIGRQTVNVSTPGIAQTEQFTAHVPIPDDLVLVKLTGDDQFAVPGTPFQDSLIVAVRDNQPAGGLWVKFELLQGDAVLSSDSTVSDMNGRAGIRMTAGMLTGAIKVRASINDSVFTDFLCAVANGKPDRMIHIYGNGIVHTVGDTIPLLAVQVLDETLAPVANVPISFSSESTGGIILGDEIIRTNNIGQASAGARVGTRPGIYYFSAANDRLVGSPIQFKVGVNPGPARKMVIVDGNNQTGKPETLLPNPLRIKITDKYQNGIINAPVIFSVNAGGGEMIESQPVTTDSAGIAYSHWKLGAEGIQTVHVITTVLPNVALQFTASLEANMPPVIDAPEDTVVVEGQELTFAVTAVDPEGGQVALTARNLPNGAAFDSLTTLIFSWTPALDQEGDYAVTFIARDDKNKTAEKIVYIHVVDKNRPPEFTHLRPVESTVTGLFFQPIRFVAIADDPDGEILSTLWYLNGKPSGKDSVFQFIPTLQTPKISRIMVLITDKKDSIRHGWDLNIEPVSVHAATLHAEQQQGLIVLRWDPRDDIYGYHIQRSEDLHGPFTRITQNTLTNVTEYKDTCPIENNVLYYKLELITKSGLSYFTEPVKILRKIPATNRIFQNYPNPFNAGTTIEFETQKTSNINLKIFNVSGTMVRRLYSGKAQPGHYSLYWDGCDDTGHPVPTGVYYGMLSSDAWRKMIKLLYLK